MIEGANSVKQVSLDVMPGICGFTCKIRAASPDKQSAAIEIVESGCTMVNELASEVKELTMQDIFTPLTQNRVFQSAEKAKCHLACPVPVAVVKAAEAAMILALPEDVSISFTG